MLLQPQKSILHTFYRHILIKQRRQGERVSIGVCQRAWYSLPRLIVKKMKTRSQFQLDVVSRDNANINTIKAYFFRAFRRNMLAGLWPAGRGSDVLEDHSASTQLFVWCVESWVLSKQGDKISALFHNDTTVRQDEEEAPFLSEQPGHWESLGLEGTEAICLDFRASVCSRKDKVGRKVCFQINEHRKTNSRSIKPGQQLQAFCRAMTWGCNDFGSWNIWQH